MSWFVIAPFQGPYTYRSIPAAPSIIALARCFLSYPRGPISRARTTSDFSDRAVICITSNHHNTFRTRDGGKVDGDGRQSRRTSCITRANLFLFVGHDEFRVRIKLAFFYHFPCIFFCECRRLSYYSEFISKIASSSMNDTLTLKGLM